MIIIAVLIYNGDHRIRHSANDGAVMHYLTVYVPMGMSPET